MNKEKLEQFVSQYHKRKGSGRKYVPFYPGVSKGMGNLIQFTQRLDAKKELSCDELVKLKEILSIKTNTYNLTQKIFLEINLALSGEEEIKRISEIRLTFDVPIVHMNIPTFEDLWARGGIIESMPLANNSHASSRFHYSAPQSRFFFFYDDRITERCAVIPEEDELEVSDDLEDVRITPMPKGPLAINS